MNDPILQLVPEEGRPCDCKGSGLVYVCMGGDKPLELSVITSKEPVPARFTTSNAVPCGCAIGDGMNQRLDPPYTPYFLDKLHLNCFRLPGDVDEFEFKCKALWQKREGGDFTDHLQSLSR